MDLPLPTVLPPLCPMAEARESSSPPIVPQRPRECTGCGAQLTAARHTTALARGARPPPLATLVVDLMAVGYPGSIGAPRGGQEAGTENAWGGDSTISRRFVDTWSIARRQCRHNRRCGNERCFLHCRNGHGHAIAGE